MSAEILQGEADGDFIFLFYINYLNPHISIQDETLHKIADTQAHNVSMTYCVILE